MKKTQGVEELVREVLQTIPKPYSNDVTEDVCYAIEKNSIWRSRYDQLVNELTKDVVNRYLGAYTKQITGLEIIRKVISKRCNLIVFYRKLG